MVKAKPSIKDIRAREILDSRGTPTVEAEVRLNDGTVATASVPSGASTGTHECLELRDHDGDRYFGKGVKKAVGSIQNIIAKKFRNKTIVTLEYFDKEMIALDGTDDKSKLGANAILAVSMALTRAYANSKRLPLYEFLRRYYFHDQTDWPMPKCMMNLINGGRHADWSTDVQEYMIIPQMKSISHQLQCGSEVFTTLKKMLEKAKLSSLVGDEGGFAPKVHSNEMPLALLVEAIEQAGYKPKRDVTLALDVAASEFFQEGKYRMPRDKKTRNSELMLKLYQEWQKKYPLESIEDGLAEDDWQGWQALTKKMSKTTLIGDDLFVTNLMRLQRGVALHIANGILIKLNQIGSVSETVECIRYAKKHNYAVAISHRSGETPDDFIADLAVACGADYLKAGSLSRGERLAKYNRLWKISEEIASKK